MKRLIIICGCAIYVSAASGASCTITTVAASGAANAEICSGGYCKTTYSYVAAHRTCSCPLNYCCNCVEQGEPSCRCPSAVMLWESPVLYVSQGGGKI